MRIIIISFRPETSIINTFLYADISQKLTN